MKAEPVAELERQLDLYRRAVNEIDDRIEYTPFTKRDIYLILLRLSEALIAKAKP